MKKSVTIKPVSKKDIGLLERHMPFGGSAKHKERLERQLKEKVVYLIAWNKGIPAGHVMVKWGGSTDEPMATGLKECPDIEDLRVHPDYYRRGIGSGLMDAAENLVRQQGYNRVGLGVGIDNRPAQLMYQRRGYNPSRFGEYNEGGSYIDEKGREQSWMETCIYLIKKLVD